MPRHATNPWLILVLICFAQFMVVLDATVVNVALPSIQKDLGLSEANLQWIINAYTLAFGGFLLLGGRAGDLLGRKRLFLFGLVVFTVASLLNGLAVNSTMLIACRGLQGLGAAFISPAALAIISTTFEEGAERAKALGVWAAIAIGGSAVGLIVGGALTQLLSWPWIFFINVPVGVAVFALSLWYLPESKAEGVHRSFDVAGAVAVTAGLMSLVFAIVQVPEKGWTSAQTIGTLVLSAVLLASFVVIEQRSKAPLVRLSIFRVRSLLTANTTMFLVGAGLFAMFFTSLFFGRNSNTRLDPIEGAARQSAKSMCLAWLITGSVSNPLVDMGLHFYAFAALAGASGFRTSPEALRMLALSSQRFRLRGDVAQRSSLF